MTWPGRSIVLVIMYAPVAYLVAGLAVHAVRVHLLGSAAVDEELARRGQSALLGHTIRQGFAWTVSPIERLFLSAGASPDALTLGGAALCALGSVVIAAGDLPIGGLLVLFSAFFDYLDGRVARQRGGGDRGGEFLDSTIDRWSDAFCFGGAAFLLRENAWNLGAALVAFGAASVVPYARAKAAALGVDLRGGLMQRPERLVLYSAAAIFGGAVDLVLPTDAPHATFTAMIWLLAAATLATAFGRTRDGVRRIRGYD